MNSSLCNDFDSLYRGRLGSVKRNFSFLFYSWNGFSFPFHLVSWKIFLKDLVLFFGRRSKFGADGVFRQLLRPTGSTAKNREAEGKMHIFLLRSVTFVDASAFSIRLRISRNFRGAQPIDDNRKGAPIKIVATHVTNTKHRKRQIDPIDTHTR